MNNSITVTTKEELKSARDEKFQEIIVTDSLANQLKKTKPIAFMSAITLGIIAAAIAATPFTGGLSAGAGLVGVATLSGLEIATIIIAASIGITLIVAVFKDYEEISYKDGEMVLRRKKK